MSQSHLVAVTAALLFSACGVDGPAESATTSEITKAPAPDVVLATVRLSPTHVVTFSETGDGYREVIEDLHADRDAGGRSVAAYQRTEAGFEELHRYLVPDAPVPAALVQADARAAARAPDPVEEFGPIPSALGDNAHATEEPGSVDWNWAADALWFKQYFYVGGSGGYFEANRLWVHATESRKTEWYQASAFNQSHESGASFQVDRSRPCGWLNLQLCWDGKNYDVPSRIVRTYKGTGQKYRKAWLNGWGPTRRVALAVRWTTPFAGSAPPVACGGHTQFACPTAPRCKPGTQEYGGGCYTCGAPGQPCCKDWSDTPTNGGVWGLCAATVCSYPSGYCSLW